MAIVTAVIIQCRPMGISMTEEPNHKVQCTLMRPAEFYCAVRNPEPYGTIQDLSFDAPFLPPQVFLHKISLSFTNLQIPSSSQYFQIPSHKISKSPVLHRTSLSFTQFPNSPTITKSPNFPTITTFQIFPLHKFPDSRQQLVLFLLLQLNFDVTTTTTTT